MVPDDKAAAKAAAPKRKPALAPEAPAAIGPAESAKPQPAAPTLVADADNGDPDKPSGGAEVVRLDRFRKK
jgi:hypothetical protein